MAIELSPTEDGRVVPAIFCDVCNRAVLRLDEGAVAWYMGGGGTYLPSTYYYIHRECEKYCPPTKATASGEVRLQIDTLEAFLALLCGTTGIVQEPVQQQWVQERSSSAFFLWF